jgi:hypothetical protein
MQSLFFAEQEIQSEVTEDGFIEKEAKKKQPKGLSQR